MAQPTCPKCDSTSFTSRNHNIAGTQSKLFMCSACGAVLGVVPDLGDLKTKIDATLAAVQRLNR